jgi:hypothetical protein
VLVLQSSPPLHFPLSFAPFCWCWCAAGTAAPAAAAGVVRHPLPLTCLGPWLALFVPQSGELKVPRSQRGRLASAVLNRAQDLFEKGEVEASLRWG